MSPLFKQFTRMPQLASPLQKQIARRPRRVFVRFMRTVVSSTRERTAQDVRCVTVSQEDNPPSFEERENDEPRSDKDPQFKRIYLANLPRMVKTYRKSSSASSMPPLLFRRPSKINNGLPVQPLIVNASWCVNVESLFLPLHCGGKDLSWS